MWKERAPRRYTILWFWSQYFDCVDINLASFAQVLHPLHPHPPLPHSIPGLREYNICEYKDGGRVTSKW